MVARHSCHQFLILYINYLQILSKKNFANWKIVCIFATESPSDEILPRPSQPKKLAIFLGYEQTESYSIR